MLRPVELENLFTAVNARGHGLTSSHRIYARNRVPKFRPAGTEFFNIALRPAEGLPSWW